MLKMATMVEVLPMAMVLRRQVRRTMSQTELRGVWVWGLTRAQNLGGG
jgi:hypothetical protein